MKGLALLTLLALVALSDCNLVICPDPPTPAWSVFCSSNSSSPGEGYLFTVVLEMPVTFFMDRSIQYCLMDGNGASATNSPLAARVANTNGTNRICLWRYDPIRLRQKSESVKLTFYDASLRWNGVEHVTANGNIVSTGVLFPYQLYPSSEEFATRFRSNYTDTFYFLVTYIGAGSTVGMEVVDDSGDLPNLNYSPFIAGDYIYAILGTIAVIIVFSLFIYGFFIQPHYL